MNPKKLVLCGLPSSGKSTFLAALSHLLTSDELPTALTLKELPESREYLIYLARKWVKFEEIERTPSEILKEVHFTLVKDEEEIDLFTPDMSGEAWESLWVQRSCSQKLAQWVSDASGIILFAHSDKIRHPVPITAVNDMVHEGEITFDPPLIEWKAAESPTQVILVDILQALARASFSSTSPNLVIVLSAWDKVSSMNLTPGQFLSSELPLLHQYLLHNRDYCRFKIYGISALGGDIDSQDIRAEDTPSKRIKVVSESDVDYIHDLTVPIMSML